MTSACAACGEGQEGRAQDARAPHLAPRVVCDVINVHSLINSVRGQAGLGDGPGLVALPAKHVPAGRRQREGEACADVDSQAGGRLQAARGRTGGTQAGEPHTQPHAHAPVMDDCLAHAAAGLGQRGPKVPAVCGWVVDLGGRREGSGQCQQQGLRLSKLLQPSSNKKTFLVGQAQAAAAVGASPGEGRSRAPRGWARRVPPPQTCARRRCPRPHG